MISVSYHDAELQLALQLLKRKLSNLTPFMREAAGILHDEVEENFAREGRPQHWQALTPRTIAARAKKGRWPGAILQSRGELAASVLPGYSASNAWVGTNKRYAAIHQFGGQAGRGRKVRIPERPFLVLTDGGKAKLLAAIHRYLRSR